jgi:hypothetical protein
MFGRTSRGCGHPLIDDLHRDFGVEVDVEVTELGVFAKAAAAAGRVWRGVTGRGEYCLNDISAGLQPGT